MIISHAHKYLFVEIPLTASYAVHRELCEYYGGVPILHKHASYADFLMVADPHERDYFVFATIRNPLDEAVSRYFKLKLDHKGTFSDPASVKDQRADYSDFRKHRYITENDLSFADYLCRYHRRPYWGMIHLSETGLDFVMRYENLQHDFSAALEKLGIRQERPIPVVNITPGRDSEWRTYYTAEIIEQAKRVFGPFMQEWDYSFPAEWGSYSPSWASTAEYNMTKAVAGLYVARFRYSQRFWARIVRQLRALLVR
jgi:hypothetical protein